MEADIKAWLVVSQAPGIGGVKFHKMLRQIGRPEKIIQTPAKELRDAGLTEETIRFIQNPPSEKINQNLSWAEMPNNTIRTIFCRQYPERLKEIKDAPPILYIKGNESLLKEPQIAIVGSRQPTPSGQANAQKFSQDIAKAGILITSGMASGIDAIAHDSAMFNSSTVAVIATGPDKIYPAKNKPLAERIAKQGVLVSEFPVGTEPVRANFPRRNRIISALSVGVVVIEADLRSGALITARLAAEQGRDVFAVPGSIHNPKAQGCHYLIQQGAKLVERGEDILLELHPQLKQYLNEGENGENHNPKIDTEQGQKFSDVHRSVLESMGYDPIDVNTLVERSGLPVHKITAVLLSLEIENYISEENGIYTRIR